MHRRDFNKLIMAAAGGILAAGCSGGGTKKPVTPPADPPPSPPPPTPDAHVAVAKPPPTCVAALKDEPPTVNASTIQPTGGEGRSVRGYMGCGRPPRRGGCGRPPRPRRSKAELTHVKVCSDGTDAAYRQQLQEKLGTHKAELEACHQSEPPINRDGAIGIELSLDEQGKVTNTKVVGFGNKKLDDCIAAKAKTWSFPMPTAEKSAPVVFAFVFNFSTTR